MIVDEMTYILEKLEDCDIQFGKYEYMSMKYPVCMQRNSAYLNMFSEV